MPEEQNTPFFLKKKKTVLEIQFYVLLGSGLRFTKMQQYVLDLKFEFQKKKLTEGKNTNTVYYLLFCARSVLVRSEPRISLLLCPDLLVDLNTNTVLIFICDFDLKFWWEKWKRCLCRFQFPPKHWIWQCTYSAELGLWWKSLGQNCPWLVQQTNGLGPKKEMD